MKGELLTFSVQQSEGYISGDDGNRYKFSAAEWRHQSPPVAGQKVDFVAANGVATEIFVVESGAGKGAGGSDQKDGLYKSSNQKMVMGVCGGLADKFGINLTILRIVMFVLCAFFFLPLIVYLVLGIVLKPRETGA